MLMTRKEQRTANSASTLLRKIGVNYRVTGIQAMNEVREDPTAGNNVFALWPGSQLY